MIVDYDRKLQMAVAASDLALEYNDFRFAEIIRQAPNDSLRFLVENLSHLRMIQQCQVEIRWRESLE